MECPICLEDIEFKFKKTLQCEHMFHKKCIDQCNDICPICRKSLAYIGQDNDIEIILNWIDMKIILKNHDQFIDILDRYKDKIDINKIIMNNIILFTNDELFKFRYYIDWEQYQKYKKTNYTVKYLLLFKNFINWDYLSVYIDWNKDWTTQDIIILKDYIIWSDVKIDINMKHIDWSKVIFHAKDNINMDWDMISKYYTFEIHELISYMDYINWRIYVNNNVNIIKNNDFYIYIFLKNSNLNLDWTYIYNNTTFTRNDYYRYNNHF